jgi:hypothetical protein
MNSIKKSLKIYSYLAGEEFPVLMEPKDSLPCGKGSAIISSPQLHSLFLLDSFQ